jgi:hypothetical protein
MDKWRWGFLGFESDAEGRPIQDWFDSLTLDQKLDIANLCQRLSRMTNVRWTRPEYDPLAGEGGVSELISNVKTDAGTLFGRIYGIRNWKEYSRYYVFLHGTNKEAKNDKEGKAVAKRRLLQLDSNQATVHEFDFQSSIDADIEEEYRSES